MSNFWGAVHNLQTTFPYTLTLTCLNHNESGQLIAQQAVARMKPPIPT